MQPNAAAAPGALGGGNSQIKRMEAKGGVVVTQKEQVATGERGDFDMRSNTVILTGNVVLTKEQNVMRGTALEFSMATGLARMTAGAPAQVTTAAGGTQAPAKPARVQGLFYPEQAATPAAPAPTASKP